MSKIYKCPNCNEIIFDEEHPDRTLIKAYVPSTDVYNGIIDENEGMEPDWDCGAYDSTEGTGNIEYYCTSCYDEICQNDLIIEEKEEENNEEKYKEGDIVIFKNQNGLSIPPAYQNEITGEQEAKIISIRNIFGNATGYKIKLIRFQDIIIDVTKNEISKLTEKEKKILNENKIAITKSNKKNLFSERIDGYPLNCIQEKNVIECEKCNKESILTREELLERAIDIKERTTGTSENFSYTRIKKEINEIRCPLCEKITKINKLSE